MQNLKNIFVKLTSITSNNGTDHDEVGFIPRMQEWFNIRKSIYVIHLKDRGRKNNYLSFRVEKAFDKTHHPFMTLKYKQRTERYFLIQSIMCPKPIHVYHIWYLKQSILKLIKKQGRLFTKRSRQHSKMRKKDVTFCRHCPQSYLQGDCDKAPRYRGTRSC